MQIIRLKIGHDDQMGGGISYIKFKGQHVAEFSYSIGPEKTQFDVYKGEKGQILVHVARNVKTIAGGLTYSHKIYETEEEFFSETSLPKELIDEAKLEFGIDEAEEIDL